MSGLEKLASACACKLVAACRALSTGYRCVPMGITGNEALVSILIQSLQTLVLGLQCNTDSVCSEYSASA